MRENTAKTDTRCTLHIAPFVYIKYYRSKGGRRERLTFALIVMFTKNFKETSALSVGRDVSGIKRGIVTKFDDWQSVTIWDILHFRRNKQKKSLPQESKELSLNR